MSQECSISITVQMHQYLQESVKQLKQKRDEIIKDLSTLVNEEKDEAGNTPYMDARRELDFINGEIANTESILALATIVKCTTCTKVTIGTKAHILMRTEDQDDEELDVIIDGICPGCGQTPVQVVTPQTPLGSVLMGAKIGDERKFTSPRGKVTRITVVSILPAWFAGTDGEDAGRSTTLPALPCYPKIS